MCTCEKFIRKDFDEDTKRFEDKHTRPYYEVDWDVAREIREYMRKHEEYESCTLDAVWSYKGFKRIDLDDSQHHRPLVFDYYTWWEIFLVDGWLYWAQITNQFLAGEYIVIKHYEALRDLIKRHETKQ